MLTSIDTKFLSNLLCMGRAWDHYFLFFFGFLEKMPHKWKHKLNASNIQSKKLAALPHQFLQCKLPTALFPSYSHLAIANGIIYVQFLQARYCKSLLHEICNTFYWAKLAISNDFSLCDIIWLKESKTCYSSSSNGFT